MNQPSPALVAQAGVRRLPRWILLLFCGIYILAGFVGRDPWRGDDITSFGYMLELAQGQTPWLGPGLLGDKAEFNALLPYWLGAWAIRLAPAWLTASQAVRIAFAAVLLLTLVCSWYTIFYLARSCAAQPVSFAFGGEAKPKDYARAIADSGLLALLACMGLAESAHETTPLLMQLCCASMAMLGLAAFPWHHKRAALVGSLGAVGLTLSGAPVVAVLLGVVGLVVHVFSHADDWLDLDNEYESTPQEVRMQKRRRWLGLAGMLLTLLLCVGLAHALQLWRWRIEPLPTRWVGWRNWIRMHLWFCWPAWPFVLLTLWRWRKQWRWGLPGRHLALPLGAVLIGTMGSLLTDKTDTMVFPVLPAYAALAAFALPTLKRSMAALIDWFALILFTLIAGYVWFVWQAALTGTPARTAQRVHRMLEGYNPTFVWSYFLVGLAATLGWLVLVRWRTSRMPHAIWKSIILPAGGVLTCWVMLTSLWLPALNHVRSYQSVADTVTETLHLDKEGEPATAQCVRQYGLSDGQLTALLYYGNLPLVREHVLADADRDTCQWLLVHQSRLPVFEHVFNAKEWQMLELAHRPGKQEGAIAVFKRVAPTAEKKSVKN